jgi:hypothetical protein
MTASVSTQHTATGVAALVPTWARVRLGTASFNTFQPAMGVPVRITAMPPRWKLPYEIAATERRLAPDRAWLKMTDQAAFGELYLDKVCDEFGPYPFVQLAQRLLDIRVAAGRRAGTRLVFLCFEKPGEFCHRRVLADWLESVGIPCPEITPKETR